MHSHWAACLFVYSMVRSASKLNSRQTTSRRGNFKANGEFKGRRNKGVTVKGQLAGQAMRKKEGDNRSGESTGPGIQWLHNNLSDGMFGANECRHAHVKTRCKTRDQIIYLQAERRSILVQLTQGGPTHLLPSSVRA